MRVVSLKQTLELKIQEFSGFRLCLLILEKTYASPLRILGHSEISSWKCWAASRWKKEPGVSNRDTNGLMEGGSYMSETISWNDPPPWGGNGGQDMVSVFAPGGKGMLPVREGIKSGWLIVYHCLPGKPAGGHALHCPFDKLS